MIFQENHIEFTNQVLEHVVTVAEFGEILSVQLIVFADNTFQVVIHCSELRKFYASSWQDDITQLQTIGDAPLEGKIVGRYSWKYKKGKDNG